MGRRGALLKARKLPTTPAELPFPSTLSFAPGDPVADRIFITNLDGKVYSAVAPSAGEGLTLQQLFQVDNIDRGFYMGGLLGFAFHPAYANNGYFFVYYTHTAGYIAVERYAVEHVDAGIVSPPLRIMNISVMDPGWSPDSHNGGWIGFGPDGFLYLGVGDGGGSPQDLTDNRWGKLLRVDVDGDDFPADEARNYAIPKDNPFVDATGDDEIWAYGLRNPWRCSFDPLLGDLYIGDVGAQDWEEVNFQVAGESRGRNFGWPCMEGFHVKSSADCDLITSALTPPVFEYPHTPYPDANCAVVGGEVYRGSLMPDLVGTYFFGDYCGGIWTLRYEGPAPVVQDRTAELFACSGWDPATAPTVLSFGRDASGEIYILTEQGIFMIVSDEPAAILQSSPSNGAIDARRPALFADGTSYAHTDTIYLGFTEPTSCLGDEQFLVSQSGGLSPPPTLSVAYDPHWPQADAARLDLSRGIEVGAWTIVTRVLTGEQVRVGALPADVDGNGLAAPADVSVLLTFLENGTPEEYRPLSMDIDVSNQLTPADLLEVVDLLTGAGDYFVYGGAALP